MRIQIVNNSKHPLPQYHSAGAAGFDLTADLKAPVTLGSLERAAIPTGIYLALPEGYESQIRGRSGLAAKHGIGMVNGVGTIDADYRGEYRVLLINLSNEPYTIHDGDRVAQVIIAKCERAEWEPVDELDETVRGNGAFGHTGR